MRPTLLLGDHATLAMGATRRIGSVPKPCTNAQHTPPSMMLYKPGTYEHVCPGCGMKGVFTVESVTL